MGMEVVFASSVREVMGQIDKTARERMAAAITEVRNKTVTTLTGNRTGATYYVPGTHKKYRASAPGEPPASMTGALRQQIRKGIEMDGKSLTGFVGSEKNYAPMLEFGTSKAYGGMKPRPWLRRSFEECEAVVKEIFTRVWF